VCDLAGAHAEAVAGARGVEAARKLWFGSCPGVKRCAARGGSWHKHDLLGRGCDVVREIRIGHVFGEREGKKKQQGTRGLNLLLLVSYPAHLGICGGTCCPDLGASLFQRPGDLTNVSQGAAGG
jgi:hypothetical protein